MKKMMILLICFVCIIPSCYASNPPSSNKIDQNEGLFDVTLVMGTIINPVEKNETITAKALYLFYYESGVFIDHGGIVRGLIEIEFTRTPFLLIYTPGPFGYISYVYGFAKEFSIHE